MAVLFSRATTGLSARTGIALYTRTPAQVTGFSVHFDGGETPKTEKRSLELLRGYDSYHAGKGWGGIGYNLAVCPVTGTVYEARGLDRVGAHTVGHNTSSIGVIVIGGEGNLTDAAKRGLQDAYDIAAKWAGKDLEVFGHKDKNSTSCPGDAIYGWIKNGGIIKVANRKPTTYVDGRLVAAGTAAAFYILAAAFKQATGYTLHVRDGFRTYEQQKDLWDRWKGYKQPPFYAPSVAYPGTSLHESGRALDVYDSGSTPGVTTAGNVRSNWVKANASKYGFQPTGYGFNEPWHIEYQGDPWAGSANVKPKEKGFLMALTDEQQAKVFAWMQSTHDILTGYAPNKYVQKGYSLPLILSLVRDAVGAGAGARARTIQDLITGGGPRGKDKSLLREILANQGEILKNLAILETRIGTATSIAEQANFRVEALEGREE